MKHVPTRDPLEIARRLHATTDAAVWAEEFPRIYQDGVVLDFGLMIGWFANAIEVGRDAGKRMIPEAGSTMPEAGRRLPGAIRLACLFHEAYERLAPEHGYETKPETRVFDATTPNGKLMIEVCREIRDSIGRWQERYSPEDK